MESSNLPFQYWLNAIYLMTVTKKSISAAEVQRQLGHKRYEPIWAMMHKLRSVMGLRDDKYELEGVEIDDAFLKTHSDDKDEGSRNGDEEAKNKVRSWYSQKLIQISRLRKNKKPSAFRYVKMIVIADSSAKTMNQAVSVNTNPSATIKSDDWRGFNNIREISSKHIKKIAPPKDASKVLP
jgi:hypothetical protein